MKIFSLFFLITSVLLSGCATNYNYSTKEIRVYKTDGSHKTYDLLSVRGDTTIVAMPKGESEIKPISYSHAEVIRHDSIIRIERIGHSSGKTSLWGAAGGFASGIIWGIASIGSSDGSGQGSYGITNGAIVITIGIIGALSGWVIGGLAGAVFPFEKMIMFHSQQDLEFLRSISLYPDKEPDEMQYIK